MKNILIFTAILTLTILAAYDTRSIMKELAAITPTQVEMKTDPNSSKGNGLEKRYGNIINNENNQPQTNIKQNYPGNDPNRNPIQRPRKERTPSLNPTKS